MSLGTGTLAGRYVLGAATTPAIVNQDLGKNSANVALTGTVVANNNFADATHWCIDVTNSQGSQKTYKYSAKSGLYKGACLPADVT